MALISGDYPTPGEVAAIETELAAFVVTNPQTGVRSIDRNALMEWLREEVDLQYSWYCGAAAAAVKSMYDGYLWQQLNVAVDKFVTAYTSVLTDAGATFPSITVDKSANAAAISKLQSDAKRYAEIITNYYDDGVAKIEARSEEWFEKNVLPLYPDPVTRNVESRVYVVTFVTDWDEESAPCPASELLEMDQNDTVTITMPTVPSGRNINRWRIYRSAAGTTAAAFLFVAELPITTTTYTDSLKPAELGEVCPTTTWLPPPTNLSGLVGMPNGVMAGFFEQTVCFCEPFVPYAWPPEYYIPLEYPIVGLGVFGQTLFVGTTQYPYFISGVDSAAMSAEKLPHRQSCVSKRSIASGGLGVMFVSPDGLCLADPSGVNVVSDKAYSREDWQALKPESMFCAIHEDVCYCFYDTGTTQGCITFDMRSGNIGTLTRAASTAYSDMSTDTLYVASGTSIIAVFGGTGRRTGIWRSKKFLLPMQAPMAWLAVEGPHTSATTVRIYVEGSSTPWYTVSVSSNEPVRLPDGRHKEWVIEIEGQSRVTSVTITSTLEEIKQL